MGQPDRYRFFIGRGMVSDDTEHAALVVEALARSAGEPQVFERELVRGLRGWILGLPAGIGWATLRACLRLLVGVSARRSGVYSAGNGPAMRAAVLGAAVEHLEELLPLVRRSTWLTHTDPKAEYAALAVAVMAYQRKMSGESGDLSQLQGLLPQNGEASELLDLLERARQHAAQGGSTVEFAHELSLVRGVSGYAYHTVPVALHACWRNSSDLLAALAEIVSCGGDTDTGGAIVGGIIGAGVGTAGIPESWQRGLLEPVLNPAGMTEWASRAAAALSTGQPEQRRWGRGEWRWPRNMFFLVVVLAHVLRRALPPY